MIQQGLFTRIYICALVALCSCIITSEALASGNDSDAGFMNAEDYRLYSRYRNALRDPRVERIPAAQRVRRIAQNFEVPMHRLQEVIEIGEEIGEGQVKKQEAAAAAALEESVVAGRIRSIQFIERRGIVVAYVGWNGTCGESLVREAAHVVKVISDAAPVVELIALWSCMGTRKVFTARIQSNSASRFNKDRIDCFAETRYIRLFEEVRNQFDGEPPEDNVGCQ